MNRCDIDLRPYIDFDYPRLLDSPLQGEWQKGSNSFRVEELPLYPFVGEGEHAAIIVEKREVTTRDLAKNVARELDLSNAAVGYAGMKDKDCVSVQAFTVTGVDEQRAAEAFRASGATVVSSTRHRNKLRLGHLAGNRFIVKVKGGDLDNALAALGRLEEAGAPNYYGPQRFGKEGRNGLDGYNMLTGGKKGRMGRWKRDLLVSALQSLLFNEYLARRIEDATISKALPGDVLKKHESGGIFICEEPEVDTGRIESFEVTPTGPMYGKKMKAATGEAARLESVLLSDYGLDETTFGRETGTRRGLITPVFGVGAEKTPDGIELHFSTPPGVFATSIVREIAASGVFRR